MMRTFASSALRPLALVFSLLLVGVACNEEPLVGFCPPGHGGDACAMICSVDAECDPGFICVGGFCEPGSRDAGVVDVGDAGMDVSVDTGPQSCRSDAACVAPEVCVFDEASGATTCGSPVGAGAVGATCNEHSDCINNLCLAGVCSAPCEAVEHCPSQFGCEGTDVAITDGGVANLDACRPSAMMCAAASECDFPDVCVVDRAGADILLTCDAPVGPGGVGAACTRDDECIANLCLNDVCTAPCAASADCSADGAYICDTRAVATAGPPANVNVCVERPPSLCLSDDDCTVPGERCVASKSATEITFECGLPNPGGGESGAGCFGDDQCAQNLCLDGVCAGPCATVGNCPNSDFSCALTPVDLAMGVDNAQVCLSPLPCDRDAVCLGSEVCYIRRANMAAELICLAPNPGGAGLGTSCSLDTDCGPNLCFAGRFGDVCVSACASDSDCSVGGYGCQATTVPSTTTTAGLCRPSALPCQAQADCDAGADCAVVPNVAGTLLEAVCVPTDGGVAEGAPCLADADCASNVCLAGTCSGPCRDANDCSGGAACRPLTIDRGGLTGMFDLCAPPSCLSDNDCPSATERCVANKTATTLDFACGPPNPGGGETGAGCMTDLECAQNLCLNGQCAAPCVSPADCAVAPTFSCSNTTVDLGAGNSDAAQLCLPPVSCDENSDCGASDTCYFQRAGAAVDLLCLPPNFAGGGLGQPCTGDDRCASNLCYPGRFGDVCSIACNDNSDCAAPGYDCQNVTVPGSSTSAGACVPAAAPPCDELSDCQPGTTCAIVENVGATALESVCIPSSGGSSSGAPCTNDDQCASLVCLGGFCAAPCTSTAQCSGQAVCANNTITKPPLSGDFVVCETLGPQPCASTEECTDGVRVCNALPDVGGVLVPHCRFPNTGAATLGSTCNLNSDCYDTRCLGLANECTVVCDEDADCAAGQGCTTYRFTDSVPPPTVVPLCQSLCQHNADCTNGNICAINADELADEIDLVCRNVVGPSLTGAPCASNSECETGMCLNIFNYDGQVCSVDGDCAAGKTCEFRRMSNNRQCATTEKMCTALCVDPTDCIAGVAGNPLTDCTPDTVVSLPSGTGVTQVSTCSRP